MNFLGIILYHAVLNLCFVYIIGQSTRGFCLLPDTPNLGRLYPNQSYFNDGEEVNCKCDNNFIDINQVKICDSGEWYGEQFVCGMK
jgi:hypothetical protein